MLISRTLESFIEVARKKNIKTASKSLNLTASPISRRIKILENWVGFKLFVRINNDFVLTEKGRAFYEEILPCHERMRILESTYKHKKCNEHRKKTLRVGTELLSPAMISKFINYFKIKRDIHHVLYFECNKESAVDKLLAEDIEILVSHRTINHERISFFELNTEHLCLLYRNDITSEVQDKSIRSIFIIEQKTIDQDNLNKISNYILTSFTNADILIVNNFLTHINLIESGHAVGVVSETFSLPQKQYKNIPASTSISRLKIDVGLKTHMYFLKENEELSRQLAEAV